MAQRCSRRSLLRGVGTVGTVGVAGLAGCIAGGTSARASVLSAGSLAVLLADRVGPAFERRTDLGFRAEFHGSAALLRMVTQGQRRPDAVISADATLLRKQLFPDFATWDVVFASNALVITYNPQTGVGRRLAAGEAWYDVLRDADAKIARSDPALDPLGYRTLMLFDLAERHYGVNGLAADLREGTIVDPKESHLLAAVGTGDRAAAVTYRNMAQSHGLPHVPLPAAIDLSDPDHAAFYATVTVTLPDGTTVTGRPILYGLTVPETAGNARAGRRFASFLLDQPDLLTDGGLVVPAALPRAHGDVPEAVLPDGDVPEAVLPDGDVQTEVHQ
ncbi:MAG: extracellular solute-binding protein [Halodesulfurarchaeum sp.]